MAHKVAFEKTARTDESQKRLRITSIIIAITVIGLIMGIVPASVGAWTGTNENVQTVPWSNLHNLTLAPLEDMSAYYPAGFDLEDLNPMEDMVGLSGELYFMTMNDTELYRWDGSGFTKLMYFAGGVAIISGLVASDEALLVSLDNGSLMRSATGGTGAWTVTLSAQTGTYAWRMLKDGDHIFYAEYGSGPATGGVKIYRSLTNGTVGSWTTVWSGYDEIGGNNHIHCIRMDPYTGYIYAITGDERDIVLRSTDNGTSFQEWGVSRQYTDIAFDRQYIYFGDDPAHDVWTYDKTTHEIQVRGVPQWGIPLTTSGAVYWMDVGANGVIYAKATVEGVDNRPAGLSISVPPGEDWYTLWNTSSTATDSGGNMLVHGGYVWTLIVNEGARSLYRFPELTFEEAVALIYGDKDVPDQTTSITYNTGSTLYDGQTRWISLGTDIIEDAQIIFTGIQTRNYIYNGSFETDEDWASAEGWKRTNYAGHELDGILSRTSEKALYGDWSMKMEGYNKTGHHFRVESQTWTDAANPIPSGTVIYFTYSYLTTRANATNYQGGSHLMNLHLVYSDDTSTDTGASYYNNIWTFSNDTWMRMSYAYTPAKDVKSLYVGFYIDGNATVYIDGVQVQTGRISPWVDYGAHNTTNPSATINGEIYTYTGTITNGATESVTIGQLGGLQNVSVSIDGSKVAGWQITGTRIAKLTNAFLGSYDGAYSFAGWNDSANIRIDKYLPMHLPLSAVKLNVSTTAQINITVPRYIDDDIKWSATGTSSISAVFTLSSLDSGVSYKVYVDGVQIYQQLKGLTTLSFTYSGPWSEHTFEVRTWEIGPGAGLQASFEYTVTGFVVSFVETTYGGSTSRIWDFGDGYGSTNPCPEHKYTRSGKYTVTLTAYNEDEESSNAQGIVEVSLGPLNPLERTGTGWRIYFSENTVLFVSAYGLGVGGAMMILSTFWLPDIPVFTVRARRLIGSLMILSCVYFVVFVKGVMNIGG